MKVFTASEANRRFSEVLREARMGHKILVTSHGEPAVTIARADTADAERLAAKQRLLDRLASQPALNLPPFDRAEVYGDS